MAKVKPDKRKFLKAIVEILPPVLYEVNEQYEVSGEDLFLANHTHIGGEEIEKEKTYLLPIPAYYEVNHLRRLEKILKDQGTNGIFTYCQNLLNQDKLGHFRTFLNKYKPYLA